MQYKINRGSVIFLVRKRKISIITLIEKKTFSKVKTLLDE